MREHNRHVGTNFDSTCILKPLNSVCALKWSGKSWPVRKKNLVEWFSANAT